MIAVIVLVVLWLVGLPAVVLLGGIALDAYDDWAADRRGAIDELAARRALRPHTGAVTVIDNGPQPDGDVSWLPRVNLDTLDDELARILAKG